MLHITQKRTLGFQVTISRKRLRMIRHCLYIYIMPLFYYFCRFSMVSTRNGLRNQRSKRRKAIRSKQTPRLIVLLDRNEIDRYLYGTLSSSPLSCYRLHFVSTASNSHWQLPQLIEKIPLTNLFFRPIPFLLFLYRCSFTYFTSRRCCGSQSTCCHSYKKNE